MSIFTITVIVLFIFFLFLLLLGYALIESRWLKIKNVTIVDNNFPAAFEDTKIAFIADIHHGLCFSKERVGKLVDKINALQPDIILLGGDYVQSDPKYIRPCFNELSNLKAPMGKFGVLGNHDHWESAPLTRKEMQKAGITLLDNNAQWIYKNKERIKIGGVGDLWEDNQDINPTIKDVTDKDFVILLSHNPDYAEKIKTNAINLVLSGHTHGGQVTFFGLWAPLIPTDTGQKYRTGIIETEFTKVVVTNGAGTVIPVRFFARPDIYVIHLKRSADVSPTCN